MKTFIYPAKTLISSSLHLIAIGLFSCISLFGKASIPEPHITIYGQVYVDYEAGLQRIRSGTITWNISDSETTDHLTEYNIEIAPFADGQFDYRLDLPVKLLVQVANSTQLSAPTEELQTLLVDQKGESFEIDLVTIYGQPVSILDGALPLLELTQQKRSQSIRMDLLVSENIADTDGDGLLDEWEIQFFGSIDTVNDDPDGDGLSNSEEFLAGTSPVDPDTDGDGYTDQQEQQASTDPLDDKSFLDLPVIYAKLYTFADLNADGTEDYGLFTYSSDEQTPLLKLVGGGLNGVTLNTLNWPARYDINTLELLNIPDMTNDGIEEVGLFGQTNTPDAQRMWQLFVRNPLNNDALSIFNWQANWTDVKAKVLSDLTRDGTTEIALQGRFKEGNRPQLFVRDGANTAEKVVLHSFPDMMHSPEFIQLTDHNNDQVEDIGFFGILKRNNKAQIRVISGHQQKQFLGAYNYPAKWRDMSYEHLADHNDDGIKDIGMFGILESDGRPQLITRSGAADKRTLSIHSWPNSFVSPTFHLTPDFNDDNVDDFAVFGIRNGLNQLMVKSGVDRNDMIGIYNWPDSWLVLSLEILPDVSGDGMPDVALFGINNNTEEVQLVVKSGDDKNKSIIQTFNFGTNWLEKKIVLLEDIDLDGFRDIGFYGKRSETHQPITTVYSGRTPSTIIHTIEW